MINGELIVDNLVGYREKERIRHGRDKNMRSM